MPSLLNLSDFAPYSSIKSQLLARPGCQEWMKAAFLGIWSPDAGMRQQQVPAEQHGSRAGEQPMVWKLDQKPRK